MSTDQMNSTSQAEGADPMLAANTVDMEAKGKLMGQADRLLNGDLAPADRQQLEAALARVESVDANTDPDTAQAAIDALNSLIQSIGRRANAEAAKAEAGGDEGGAASASSAGTGGGTSLTQIFAALGDLVNRTFEPALAEIDALGPDAEQGDILKATAGLQVAAAVSNAAGAAKDSVAGSATTLAQNR